MRTSDLPGTLEVIPENVSRVSFWQQVGSGGPFMTGGLRERRSTLQRMCQVVRHAIEQRSTVQIENRMYIWKFEGDKVSVR